MLNIIPEIFIEFNLKEYGVKGYLAIDKLINNMSWGGLRIVISDLSKEEVIALARTMTNKYAFLGLLIGGAKATIEIPLWAQEKRAEILCKFGERLKEHIKNELWSPAFDMNCTTEDLDNLFKGAGVERRSSSWKNISHVYTAWSVYISTLAALSYLKEDLKNKTFILQGFGKVGMEYCKMMHNGGAKLLATSTRYGAIYDQKGLNVTELIDLGIKYGDEFVLNYKKGEKVDINRILELEADVAVPCAHCFVINTENVDRVKSRIIPCAANVAMNMEIEKKLFSLGKIIIPDFVANCGGVFGSHLEKDISSKAIYNILKTKFRRKVDNLLKKSRVYNKSISELTLNEIDSWLLRTNSVKQNSYFNWKGKVKKIMPNFIKELCLPMFYSGKYFA